MRAHLAHVAFEISKHSANILDKQRIVCVIKFQ
jgi:hypothetical protein